jgi:molybdenum cofactor synthesis domain-containing protein
MCTERERHQTASRETRTIPIEDAIGTVLAHDVTEIRKDEFKGRVFKKGHVVQREDIPRFKQIGKEHLFVLNIAHDEMHEDEAALALADALMGDGVAIEGEPKEGKITLIADRDGLLKIEKDTLVRFNMLGEVLCSTLHNNTVVKRGRVIAGTKAVPLVVKRSIIEEAVSIAGRARSAGTTGVISVRGMRKPRAGVVITGREVYDGRIKDSFAPMVAKKIEDLGGEIIGTYYAPDDRDFIRKRVEELVSAGADLLIVTGGMSVDPDDVTRFAIRELGAVDVVYGSPVLPGAMMLVGYIDSADWGMRIVELEKSTISDALDKSAIRNLQSEMIPILGIPACGMYHKTTVIDLLLPRILANEKIGRRELAELGHGGMCLNCQECRYPECPFGK